MADETPNTQTVNMNSATFTSTQQGPNHPLRNRPYSPPPTPPLSTLPTPSPTRITFFTPSRHRQKLRSIPTAITSTQKYRDPPLLNQTHSSLPTPPLSFLLTPGALLPPAPSPPSTPSPIKTSIFISTLYRQGPQSPPDTSTFRSIGAGTCGEVFTAPGSDTVHKVALTTDGQLNREYNTHKHLQACFEKHPAVRSEVLMTRVLGFVGSAGGAPNEKEEENSDDEKQKKREDKDSASWGQNAANLFPSTINTPAPVLSTTLIHPLPSLIRRQLITFYCPFVLKRQATHADENRDCLIRLYLGRRRTQSPSRAALRDYQRSPQFFNLRNYSLHLDQMEELGLSVEMYARGMGAALAVMHWEGGVDGEDVEFVLGSAPTPLPSTVSSPSALSARPSTTSQPQSQQTHLFLLDFDKVKEISFDRDGVYQAVKAFYRNDPYYPRPLASTTYAQTVWETFKTRYLAVSEEIVAKSGDQIKALPQLFIDGLVEERRRRVERFERLRAEAEGSLSEYEKLLARKEGERWNAAQINFGDLERLVWG